ncbi:MAG: hypothetical protein B7Y05_25600 [Polynucleobacter sp. 24-46-87]|jgi:prefoldin subunit 5|nr:MAG: hypothetical protein B7Y55_10905 [Polynucleobacter sp. 35-46-207]OZA00168.1 MAG: hypothetical protein B7Y05_25600 [Polynucleobacter sp. 24-46-87]OZB36186.1 MAG: hypothetical protein B7X60_13470 [Polynucleobacter sp. 39-45-136]
MGNSTLHAIAIDELRHSNPNFYNEYELLIEGISAQIRELAKNQADRLDYSSFTESYDRASHEPVLQVVIGIQKTELYIHIYIHKDNYFVIGKSGSGTIARNVEEALELVSQKIKTIKE